MSISCKPVTHASSFASSQDMLQCGYNEPADTLAVTDYQNPLHGSAVHTGLGSSRIQGSGECKYDDG